MKKYLYLLFSILVFSSCVPENENLDYDSLNETDIQEYISRNNLTPQKSSSGLYYIITKEGNGAKPTSSSNVTLEYKGYLLTGSVFDQNNNATFDLNRLIPGFAEGMTYVREGGEATLIIPSKLAYGSVGSGRVSPGAVILFDVKLKSIN